MWSAGIRRALSLRIPASSFSLALHQEKCTRKKKQIKERKQVEKKKKETDLRLLCALTRLLSSSCLYQLFASWLLIWVTFFALSDTRLKREFSRSCSVRHTSPHLLSTAEVADTCVLLHFSSVLAWMSSYCEDLGTSVTSSVPTWSNTSLEQCWRTLSNSFWSACPRSTALPLSNKSVKQAVR